MKIQKKCLASWRRGAGVYQRRKEMLKRQIKSLAVCKVDLGNFGYYKKANSMRIIGKIIYFTVKGLMLMPKLNR